MVSINLMTGLPYENLLALFERRLKNDKEFSITISLLNPDRPDLMTLMGASLDIAPEHLSESIRGTLNRLVTFRKESLSINDAARFVVRIHDVIPFGSAIIRDHVTDKGKLQIETKVYKAPINSSFAFEVTKALKQAFMRLS